MNHPSAPIRHDLFGFHCTPFLGAPPEPFLNDERKAALAGLERFLAYRGFAAVGGPSGCGKTSLLEHFCKELYPANHKIMYLSCGAFSACDLLRAVCAQLDLEPSRSQTKTLATIAERLHSLGSINPVLVFDEMQNASHALLELVRLLSSSRFDRDKRLSAILIGTDSFFAQLSLAINESLRQRVTYFCQLRPLNEEDCAGYLCHCLRQAGACQEIFDAPSTKLIYDLSHGVLRLVDTLARSALAVASTAQQVQVNVDHLRAAQDMCLLPDRRTRA